MSDTAYQVLARKYRPDTFADLIGQGAMVRTLKNAFEANRIAHAFIMTGVRGVGKTTTARIIAKGLNCVGPDGQGGPTIEPCGQCEPCTAISEGRHVDVLEMDAASRTGVGDIREIIDSVAYRAASARYKVYIIDEVHMLSTSAFNALLKTLEEPPEHVKFIFATTEIRKVPVTVLSRCQRFDLRRIEAEEMIGFLSDIATKEGATIAHDALALITRASEGSARDALSLLDQAIAHGAGETGADQVRAMLGLADRGRVLDLFDLVMHGKVADALRELAAQYAEGADPVAVIRDMAEVTHWISVVKITPEALEDPTISPDERTRGGQLAEHLPMRALTRSWQMLLKIIDEVSLAPNAMMAAEMGLIRLTHVSDLPSPEDLIRRLKDIPPGKVQGAGSSPQGGSAPAAPIAHQGGAAPVMRSASSAHPALHPDTQSNPLARYALFDDVVALVRAKRDAKLLYEIDHYVRLARYTPGHIEFEPAQDAPPALAATLAQRLTHWTGARWAVSIVSTGGAATRAEELAEHQSDLKTQAASHPLVQAVLAAFPGAEIRDVRVPEQQEQGNEDIVPIDPDEIGEDWTPLDPFGED